MVTYLLYPILLISPILFLIWNFRFKPRTLPGIPAWPNDHFFWGDLLRLKEIMKNKGSFTDFLDLSAEVLGPICQVRLGPFAHMVIITDYHEVESLLLRRHQSLDRSSQTTNLFKTILPKALLTLKTGDVWRYHRKIIGSTMTPHFLSLTLPNISEAADELVELWKLKMKICNEGEEPKSWKAEVDLESATMDTICGMAFGGSWGILSYYRSQLKDLENRLVDINRLRFGDQNEVKFELDAPELAKSTWYIFQSVPAQSPLPALTHSLTSIWPAYRHHIKQIDEFLENKILQARKKASTLCPDMAAEIADNTLDLMIAKEIDGGTRMSSDEMKQELFQYLLAGTETTSTTLAWWCKYMTNNPLVQKRLRAHLEERLPNHPNTNISYEDLSPNNVPYLEAVVHETLRMARTAGGYLRDTKEDMIILGRHIPKGTTLAFPTSTGFQDRSSSTDNTLQSCTTTQNDQARRVGYWETGTGHTFDPERWLTSDGRFNPIAGPSLPFSLGQRRCFGKNLALLELRVFIVKLNLSFFFAPVPEHQNSFERVDNVISHPKDCFIRLVPWDCDEAA